jgi:Na+/H+ antiporter NhaD/arsenite permease-like protein
LSSDLPNAHDDALLPSGLLAQFLDAADTLRNLIPSPRQAALGTIAGLAVLLMTASANAAVHTAIDGTKLGLFWMLPFAGILGSLALFPIAAPHFWHRNYGYVVLFWSLTFAVPFAAVFGAGAAFRELLHVLIAEYIPFIVLIGALFAIAGGIYAGGTLHGSPGLNLTIMLAGMFLASFAGTTGAAMILIRPLIRANRDRHYKTHVAVFFIFLVCNIGGALTPLGDPPLFLGYLKGVDFLWPLKVLWPHTLVMAALVLGVFFALDLYLFAKEGGKKISPAQREAPFVRGLVNVPLFVLVVATVALSGSDSLGKVQILGTGASATGLLRDFVLIILGAASLLLTPRVCREQNEFNWEPVLEVAKLFAAIFVTMVPAIAILKAGPHGSLAPLLALLGGADAPNNTAYFWLTGLLSSFLDNAPTYLVFFNAAGGDPETLMGPMSQTLAAISAGAVFMGANTYIGNAPNLMVKAIAEHLGVKMPGFLGFMLWSGAVLMPAFLLLTVIFFR